MRRKLAAGNWKMNGTQASLAELRSLAAAVVEQADTDVLICPPATLITRAVDATQDSPVAIGAQDCHAEVSGAYTGDIAANMIMDAGATHVILGHSERRQLHGETDAVVHAKSRAALDVGLTAIICLGETQAERDAGRTLDVLGAQLAGSCPDSIHADTTVIAYEPVWAIGTGRVPSFAQICEAHDFLRAELVARFGADGDAIRLLYGGSVKAENAAEIFAADSVDGALVGGASLKAQDFLPIVEALQSA